MTTGINWPFPLPLCPFAKWYQNTSLYCIYQRAKYHHQRWGHWYYGLWGHRQGHRNDLGSNVTTILVLQYSSYIRLSIFPITALVLCVTKVNVNWRGKHNQTVETSRIYRLLIKAQAEYRASRSLLYITGTGLISCTCTCTVKDLKTFHRQGNKTCMT